MRWIPLLLLGCAAPPPAPVSTFELESLRSALSATYAGWFADDGLRRVDGHAYTVDVAHLLEHAAASGDADLYARVYPTATGLIVDRPDDPYTHGFVAWRSGPVDASGTTEALHLARALRRGARAFDRPSDAALARRLIEGYARHAYVDRGVWLVRNYFNFGTRAFANDSFLVDYEPDLLAELADDDPSMALLAERSAAMVHLAQSEAGLVHTMLQPDLGTVMPDIDVGPFSPNDVVQLNNACAVALCAVRSAPWVARRVLDFGAARWDGLQRYYYGRTGEAAFAVEADLSTRTCLLHLAARLNDSALVDRWLPELIGPWRRLPADPVRRIFTLGETLLTLDTLIGRR